MKTHLSKKITKKRISPNISIGIMCHNEGKNIDRILNTIVSQTCYKRVKEVIIVSSGSTDATNKILEKWMAKNKIIHVIIERKRKGKAKAVNIFLSKSKSPLIVLLSADLILRNETIECMLKHFDDKNVGIVGSHPVPINQKNTFIGFAVHMLWDLHHKISLQTPKMGELIVFRKVFKKIPSESSVDEVNIESLVINQGYKAVYEPQAIIFNKGPETISEFIRLRRRIYSGHMLTKKKYGYTVSTLNDWKVLFIIIKGLASSRFNYAYLFGTIILEIVSRMLGTLDYRFNFKDHSIWDVISTSKNLR